MPTLRPRGEECKLHSWHLELSHALRDAVNGPRLPDIPLGKRPIGLTINFLTRLFLQLFEGQLARVGQPIHALLLIGSFASSDHLKQRVKQKIGKLILSIARPPGADTATLRSTAQYCLAKRSLVSTVICSRPYIMKVESHAERGARHKKPAYIKINDPSAANCENWLQFLASKGAIIRKGRCLTTMLRKFSESPSGTSTPPIPKLRTPNLNRLIDSPFIATLYTSDSEKIMRYTNEDEILELCERTVDFISLPSSRMRPLRIWLGSIPSSSLGVG
ncbi:hypothetical protein EST38_g12336 [Candolleomyces aberdarensis]|uniref:Uncharacterized protein n=1 Tax=Candolleomyces aberdarensis TaxID=2316362 RepID=A0A4Q2D2M3_9AGAR|nr:hypothetical protein EST38_g12336 [Candolleomyces aberdarensis]